jgi:uncharacterized membrane protein
MSILEEHVDVGVPIDKTWDDLHRVENYPRFVEGVREVHTEAGGGARLDVEAGGRARVFEAEISDREGERVMEWHATSDLELGGSFSLQPINENRTRVQARLEYDPDAIRETFGGLRGFAQVNAIERLVRSDLEHFKEYVEQGG